jgi:hypothetical protein
MALTPFDILNADMALVFDIYVNCIIHDSKNKNKTDDQEEWVTSKTANWH